jgi:hypothetical protein
MTKPDISRRELSVAQLNAIDLLVVGKTDQETAEAVGVTRQTVNGWRNKDPWFQAELNRRRQEVWGTAVDSLRALLPRAIAVLAHVLHSPEDHPAVALSVLKLAGLDFSNAPVKLDQAQVGPTDPGAIIDAAVRARRPDRDRELVDLLAGGPIGEDEREEVLEVWGVACR